MIFWSGKGYLVLIVWFCSFIATEYISELITNNELYFQENPWLMFIVALITSGVILKLNETILKSKTRILIDKESGEEIELKEKHTLFFIEAKWWAIIFILISIIYQFEGSEI